jgi:hypothetical protein
MRSTIKREEETMARYPKSWRPEKAGVPDIVSLEIRYIGGAYSQVGKRS